MSSNNWTQMPSGRWVRTVLTRHGHAALHAWDDGRWEVTRGMAPVARGSEWSRKLEDAMERAETWVGNLIECER